MSLRQALVYFVHEAWRNLVRGWRISSLAVATTALSLFIGASLILLGSNLAKAVESWRSDAQIAVYLEPDISAEALAALKTRLESEASGLGEFRYISSAEAHRRFRRRFPELEEVTRDLDSSPLPASLELSAVGDYGQVRSALEEVALFDGVAEIDDDGEWLASMDAVASIAGLLGLVVGGILIVAAAVSIASVVRLSTFVYRKEIGAMRLIGATEFFVRGPFVVEGLMQGLLGSGIALAALWAGYEGLGTVELPWFVRGALLDFFLTRYQVLAVLALGGVAGLVGGLIPLREKSGVFG